MTAVTCRLSLVGLRPKKTKIAFFRFLEPKNRGFIKSPKNVDLEPNFRGRSLFHPREPN